MFAQTLSRLMQRQNLTQAEAEAEMDAIMRGERTPAQIAGFLVAMAMKGETVDEITGFARAMRRAARQVRPQRTDLVDTCGTGGDAAGTFNISTTAAFVVAGTGLGVAKHGNRSISSRSGSADVLQALGASLDLEPEDMARALDEVGFAFLFAPRLHPAMKHAIGPRRELGVRTVFNILGPLTNPAGARAQIMGVYDPDLVEPLARVLQALGVEAAYVVHGNGLDELTLDGPNRVARFGTPDLPPGEVRVETLRAEDVGLRPAPRAALRGGTPEENARITRAILEGRETGPRRDVVLLNAAAALVAGGAAADLAEGLARARQSLDSGAALDVLERYVAFTQRVAAARSV